MDTVIKWMKNLKFGMSGWMNEQTNERTNEWMNKRMNEEWI